MLNGWRMTQLPFQCSRPQEKLMDLPRSNLNPPQASQTHDSRNRSNIYDLSTRIECDVTALCVRCCVTHWTVERSIYKDCMEFKITKDKIAQ